MSMISRGFGRVNFAMRASRPCPFRGHTADLTRQVGVPGYMRPTQAVRGYRAQLRFREEFPDHLIDTASKTTEQRSKIFSVLIDVFRQQSNDYHQQDRLPVDKRRQYESELQHETRYFDSHDPNVERHRFSYFNSLSTNQKNADSMIRQLFGDAAQQVKDQKALPDHPELLSFMSPDGGKFDFTKMAEQNREYLQNKLHFNQDLQAILDGTDIEARKRNLEQFIFNKEGGIGRFSNEQLSALFHAAWDINAKKIMVEMMETSKDVCFTGSPQNLQFYAQAQLKSRYENIYNAIAVANLLLEIDPDESQAYIILGIVGAIKSSAAHNFKHMKKLERYDDSLDREYHQCFPEPVDSLDTVEINYQESVNESIKYYKKAFELTKDPRIGRLLILRYFEQGSYDSSGPQRARNMAKLTQLAALKEGGIEHANFSVVRALLESSYVLGEADETLDAIEARLISLIQSPSQIENAIGQMAFLVDHLDPKYRQRVNDFVNILERIDEDLREGKENIVAEDARRIFKGFERQKSGATQIMHDRGYTLRGALSNWVGGNFKFGGQLPDKNINRTDWKVFREILKTPLSEFSIYDPEFFENTPYRSFGEIQDVETFSDYCDHLIRGALNIDVWDMEDLYSKGHEKYDSLVQKIIYLSGAQSTELRKKVPHSKTNISMVLTTGLGDCRHVTQIKQMLFQVWQNERLEGVIDEYQQVIDNQGTEETIKTLEQKFHAYNREQMMIFDFEVHMPVEMTADNRPKRNAEGQLVAGTGENQFIEEHTMNCIVKMDIENQEVESFRTADGFYQKEYPFGNCSINVDAMDPENGFQVANREARDAENRPQRVAVTLKPTVYSGPRNQYDRGSSTLYYCGVPMSVSPSVDHILGMKPEKDDFLEQLSQWEM